MTIPARFSGLFLMLSMTCSMAAHAATHAVAKPLAEFRVCLNQAINVRFIDDESAEAPASIEYRDGQFQKRRLYCAWD